MKNVHGYLVASLLWGLNIPMMDRLLRAFDPFWLAPCRQLVAAAVLGLWVWATLGRAQLASPLALWRVAVMSAAVAGFLVLFNLGLKTSSPINTAAVMAGSPVYVAVVSRLMTGARLQRGFWGATLLTLLGAGLALQGRLQGGTLQAWRGGELLIVGAVASWTVYTLLSQRWFAADVPQLRRTWLTTVGAVPWLLGVWVLARAGGWVGPPRLDATPAQWTYLAGNAALCAAVATVAWNHGVARLGIQSGAVWQNMVPVFAVLISLLFFGVVPTLAQVAGGLVVMSGVLWMQWHRRRSAASVA
jgi:drug/metabolite transporter (DMT)-like permease